MFKHRIVIETNSPEELARRLIAELTTLAKPIAKSKVEIIDENRKCEVCNCTAIERRGVGKSGKPYHGIFCINGNTDHTKWLRDV